jgi:hypothetical protein
MGLFAVMGVLNLLAFNVDERFLIDKPGEEWQHGLDAGRRCREIRDRALRRYASTRLKSSVNQGAPSGPATITTGKVLFTEVIR